MKTKTGLSDTVEPSSSPENFDPEGDFEISRHSSLFLRKGLNMSGQNYKNVIIGSGEGGKYLAWHLAQSGQPTVVVERRWVGGSCPNVNCLPSKNEIWSAKVADLMHHGTSLEITL